MFNVGDIVVMVDPPGEGSVGEIIRESADSPIIDGFPFYRVKILEGVGYYVRYVNCICTWWGGWMELSFSKEPDWRI